MCYYISSRPKIKYFKHLKSKWYRKISEIDLYWFVILSCEKYWIPYGIDYINFASILVT